MKKLKIYFFFVRILCFLAFYIPITWSFKHYTVLSESNLWFWLISSVISTILAPRISIVPTTVYNYKFVMTFLFYRKEVHIYSID